MDWPEDQEPIPGWTKSLRPVTGGIHPTYIDVFLIKTFHPDIIRQRREQDQDTCLWLCKHCFQCADLCGQLYVYALKADDPIGINAPLRYCLHAGTWKCSSLASITLLGWTTNTYHCQSFRSHWCHRQAFSVICFPIPSISPLSNQRFLNYLYQLI